MPTRLRKVRKFRGSRSHGWGQSAGHRGAGSHGGFGRTGGHKHGWTYTVSHQPDHYGKRGFYHRGATVTTMNVGELDQLANELLLKGQATKEEDGISIDLNSLGVDKLLGSGKISRKLVIRVKNFSALACRKIREANGNISNVE